MAAGLLFALAACAREERAPVSAPLQVRLGVEVAVSELPAVLAGKRVGLITNHSGRDHAGTSTIDLLHEHPGLELVALYAPEHGIRGEATGHIADEMDEKTGLPIYSLYGEHRKPTPEMLEGVEALVFEAQDVGVRQYTYITTMAMGMQAAAEKGIPFVVLDRPNPIGGVVVEGNLLDPEYSNFAGYYPIASRHGMTIGELARMFNEEFGIGADLTVVAMEGWRREAWFDDTDVPWVKPSPNLPTLEGAIHYPGTVFFEGTNVSEGRGSERPFELIGAPWMSRAAEVADSMNALGLAGVRFEAVEYDIAPGARKYGGEHLQGVRLVVTDRESYRPVTAALLLMDMIRRLHPAEFEWRGGNNPDSPGNYTLDRLIGTDRVRLAIENGTLPALLEEWKADEEKFRAMRKPYLLY